MSQYVKVTTEDELTHWGVLGMKWGVRKDRDGGSGSIKRSRKQKKADKLSKKYGVEVGEGVTEKEVIGAAKAVGQMKTNVKMAAVEEYQNAVTAYYAEVAGKSMSKAEFDRVTKKTNKLLADIDETHIVKLSERKTSEGRRHVDITLNEISKTSKPRKPSTKQTNSKPDLTQRFNNAKAKNPKLDYNTIYKSDVGKKVMDKWQAKGLDRNTILEDPSYYKEVEDLWLKKQGF